MSTSGLRKWPLPAPEGEKIELIPNPHRSYTKCEIFLILCVVAVLISVAIVAIFAIVYTSNAAGVRTYCLTENDSAGYIRFNQNDRTIAWYVQYPTIVGTPTNLYIKGPILPGATTAALYFSICGSPSSLACDLSVPGVLSGTILELNPGGSPLKPYIEQVNSNPSLYYATSNNVTLGRLSSLC
jgi:hypothetical protein